MDAAAQWVRRAGQEIPALGTAPIDAPVVAAGHAVQPGLVEESLSAAGPWAGQESPAPIQEPAHAEKHAVQPGPVEESLGAAGPVQAGEILALMDEPVAAAGHAAQTGQDIPAPIEEPMEAAEPVVEPEGNHVKASEDRVTPTVKNQSDPAAGSTGNSMKDDNGKKTKTSKPAKEENKNKAKKQDDKKDNEQDEKKTAAHRASSLLWHQKYVRKGVLRNPEDDAKKNAGNLSEMRFKFLKDYKDKYDGEKTGMDLHRKAIKAWMDSDERSQALAAKEGICFMPTMD